jgi:hypothetical protein
MLPKQQYLFSYSALQQEGVQLEVMGRALPGVPDRLPFFEHSVLEVVNGGLAATEDTSRYLLARYSGRHTDVIEGTAFPVTRADLRETDKYEGAAYRRVASVLGSGVCAWVYVDARSSFGGTPFLADHTVNNVSTVHTLSVTP